jgi:hypothetical protein
LLYGVGRTATVQPKGQILPMPSTLTRHARFGAVWICLAAAASSQAAETIIFVRHGEKPTAGLGQLSCRGLNRALALPKVLAAKFPSPTAIYAPNPAERKKDHGVAYDYVRPLATVEPTAIALGMPVDTRFGVSSFERFRKQLTHSRYRNSNLLVAWEHKQIVRLARELIARSGGDPGTVPPWRDDDFGSIYVVTIDGGAARLQIEQQNLDALSDSCPGT